MSVRAPCCSASGHGCHKHAGFASLGFQFKEYQKPQISRQEAQALMQQEQLEDDHFIYVSYSGI